MNPLNQLSDYFSMAQQWFFEYLLQPIMLFLGMSGILEDGYVATTWFFMGILQIAVMLAVIGPLQRWRPVEQITDHQTIKTDVIYTLIHRLGFFRLALFFAVEPLFDLFFGALHSVGYGAWHLDQVWPGVTDVDLVSFVIYLVIFDFLAYWTHRAQHQVGWWWSLHSLHHAQRQMTMWSDNRNHLLDDLLVDALVVLVAKIIGVPPGQFVAMIAFTQLSESLQHANLRLWFGRFGERLWISPRFHRMHHSIGAGHETIVNEKSAAQGAKKTRPGGHNFGVLLPWWDMMFGTANFDHRYSPTGVRDQVERGRNYGSGFWSQQWQAMKRLTNRA